MFDTFGDFKRDRCGGSRRDLNRLLDLIAEHSIKNLYILTGDLHAGHAIEVTLSMLEKQPLTLWEFCASPFEQKTNRLA